MIENSKDIKKMIIDHERCGMTEVWIWLPVFKQGDDLASNVEALEKIESEGGTKYSPADAFAMLAGQYQYTSEICMQISELITDIDERISISAGTHSIHVYVPEEIADVLVAEGIGEYMDEIC